MGVRSIAIVGFAWTQSGHHDAQVDEIWTMNRAYASNIKRIDRLFELHRPSYIFDSNQPKSSEYLDWLMEPHDFPIYMIEEDERFPSAVEYPLDAICDDVFAGLSRGEAQVRYMTSTAAMMMALAIHEKVERIELYGIELSTTSEYVYQRDGMALLVGIAMGRGIEVVLPTRSRFLKAKVYGYEAYQMITRQTLETYLGFYKIEMQKWLAETNQRAARFDAATKNGHDAKELDDLNLLAQNALGMANEYGGCIQLLEKLIEECDLQEPEKELRRMVMIEDADTHLQVPAPERIEWNPDYLEDA